MGIIEFRDPKPEDLDQLNFLKRRYIPKVYDDDSFLAEETLTWEYLQSCRPLIFTTTVKGVEDIVIGAVEFTDTHPLWARLHFTFYPRFVPVFLKEKVYLDALIDRFRFLAVDSFVVSISAYNEGVASLAKRVGFKEKGRIEDQYRHFGKKYDELILQLKKTDLILAIRQAFLESAEEEDPICQDIVTESPKVAQLPTKKRRRRKNEQQQKPG